MSFLDDIATPFNFIGGKLGSVWDVLNHIDFSRQTSPGGSFGAGSANSPYINRGGSSPPRPPALSERDAISNFRQGERDSQNGGSSFGRSDMPSIAEIMARLQELQSTSRYSVDPSQLMQQAQAQAGAQYDPVIAQLRNAMGTAETRGNRNKQALGEMFGQLSTSLQGDIPGIQQEYAQTGQTTNDQFGQLKNSIADTYKTTQADQEAMMKRLNIEAAAPEALAQQQTDQAYFQNRANADQQTAQTALGQEARGNTEYTRRGSEVARVEGTQRQADLMSQLQDVLNAYQGQIGANESAKASAVQSMFGQLQTQAQDSAFKYSQRDFDNYLSSINIGRQLKNDQYTQNAKMYPDTANSLSNVAGRALGMGLPQSSAQNIQNVFSSALGSDKRILGGMNPDSGTPLAKEQLAQYVVEAGRQQGLSEAEIHALQAMALEYFGRA
jgi:hypothetical protein